MSLPLVGPFKSSLPDGRCPDVVVAAVVRVVVAAVDVVVVALLLKSLLPEVVYMSRLAILAEHHSGVLGSRRRHREQSHVTINYRSFFPRHLISNNRTSISCCFLNHVTLLTTELCRQSRPTSTKLFCNRSNVSEVSWSQSSKTNNRRQQIFQRF